MEYRVPCMWGDLVIAAHIARQVAEANDGTYPKEQMDEVFQKDVLAALQGSKPSVYDWADPEYKGVTFAEVWVARKSGQPEDGETKDASGGSN
jgi:hypothetical protein